MYSLFHSPFFKNYSRADGVNCPTLLACVCTQGEITLLMTECFGEECGKIHGNAWDIVGERRIEPVHHSCSSNQRLRNVMLGTEEICHIINLGAVLKNK